MTWCKWLGNISLLLLCIGCHFVICVLKNPPSSTNCMEPYFVANGDLYEP